MKFIAYALLVFLVLPFNASQSQTPFKEFEEQDKEAASETEKFRAVLNGEDPERALRAMQFMLESGDPILVWPAREFGLLSSNGSVQNAALNAIFDHGGPFRLVVDLTNLDESKIRMGYYIGRIGGSVSADKKSASFIFYVDKAKDCWVFKNADNCAFVLQGSSVSLAKWFEGTGELSLNDEGKLKGAIGYYYSKPRYSPVPAYIDLLN